VAHYVLSHASEQPVLYGCPTVGTDNQPVSSEFSGALKQLMPRITGPDMAVNSARFRVVLAYKLTKFGFGSLADQRQDVVRCGVARAS
jgi:hypothetical protein